MSGTSRPAPEVSVVVPAYNAGPYIDETLRSILAQRDVALECIVIDDGSTDDTAARVEQHPGVTLVRIPNRGVSHARNLGIATATAPLIAFCDADDLWHPDKLRLQLADLRANPTAGMVVSGWETFGSPLPPHRFVPVDPPQALRRWLTARGDGFGIPSTAVIRREVLDAVGGFDTSLSGAADIALAVEVARVTTTICTPQVLMYYRQHATQMSRDFGSLYRESQQVVARIDDRSLRRHAEANLEAVAVLKALRSRHPRAAVGHLGRSLRTRPLSVFEILARRASFRVVRLLTRGPVRST